MLVSTLCLFLLVSSASFGMSKANDAEIPQCPLGMDVTEWRCESKDDPFGVGHNKVENKQCEHRASKACTCTGSYHCKRQMVGKTCYDKCVIDLNEMKTNREYHEGIEQIDI